MRAWEITSGIVTYTTVGSSAREVAKELMRRVKEHEDVISILLDVNWVSQEAGYEGMVTVHGEW